MQERTRKEGMGRNGTDAKKAVSRETGGFVNSAVIRQMTTKPSNDLENLSMRKLSTRTRVGKNSKYPIK